MFSASPIPPIVRPAATAAKMRLASKSAFSLVEVVIALGIFTFALVTMMGLLTNGLSAVHSSVNATVVSEIVQQIRTSVEKSTNATLASQAAQTEYFDNQGVLTPAQTPAGSVYQAVISAPALLSAVNPSVGVFSAQGTPATLPPIDTQLYEVTVTVSYAPGGVSSAAYSPTKALILITPID